MCYCYITVTSMHIVYIYNYITNYQQILNFLSFRHEAVSDASDCTELQESLLDVIM